MSESRAHGETDTVPTVMEITVSTSILVVWDWVCGHNPPLPVWTIEQPAKGECEYVRQVNVLRFAPSPMEGTQRDGLPEGRPAP